jgi:NADPH:quinone reductase-like Zn-dependent oxidoreductase
MRAVVVRKPGDAPELMELPVPRPAPGEVLVKLEAASVNPIDAVIAAGLLGDMPSASPLVLGVDGTGRVAETGGRSAGSSPAMPCTASSSARPWATARSPITR